MIVRVFHNRLAFNNILCVQIKQNPVVSYKTSGNVTKLLDKDEQIVGYNIIVDNFESNVEGYQPMTYDLLRLVNRNLNEAFQEELIHDFKNYIVVGHVDACEPHPDSDHMHVCQVNVGKEIVQIVCGAHNIDVDQRVVVCLENAVLPSGALIQAGKLRGVESRGMIASEYELGLIEEAKRGILVLDTTYEIGQPFLKG